MKRLFTTLFSVLLVVCCVFTISACSDATVSLSETTREMEVGETYPLIATVDGSEDPVIWRSSDKTVVTVEGGVLTALKTGTATVTATVGNASASCSITVLPEIVSYNKGNPENGTVTVTGGKRVGDEATVTLAPDANYGVGTVTVDGVEVEVTNNSFTFTATKNSHAIVAQFVANAVAVTVSDQIQNGSVTVSPNPKFDGSVTLTFTPAFGYELVGATLNNAPIAVVGNTYNFTATELEYTVNAVYAKKDVSVEVTAPVNGTVTITENIKFGDTVTITATPGNGYEIDTITVLDGANQPVAVNDNSFVAEDLSYTVTVTFAAKAVTVTVASGIENGTVTVSANPKWHSEVTLTVAPANGYKLKSLTLDDNPVTVTENKHTFTASKESYTVNAEFERIEVAVNITVNETKGTVTNNVLDKIYWFDAFELTFEAKQGYSLYSVTVNGTDVTDDVKADNKYAVNSAELDEYSVVAVFIEPEILVATGEFGGDKYLSGQYSGVKPTFTWTDEKAYGSDSGSVQVTVPSNYIEFSLINTNSPVELTGGEWISFYVYYETTVTDESRVCLKYRHGNWGSGDETLSTFGYLKPNAWNGFTLNLSGKTSLKDWILIFSKNWSALNAGDKIYFSSVRVVADSDTIVPFGAVGGENYFKKIVYATADASFTTEKKHGTDYGSTLYTVTSSVAENEHNYFEIHFNSVSYYKELTGNEYLEFYIYFESEATTEHNLQIRYGNWGTTGGGIKGGLGNLQKDEWTKFLIPMNGNTSIGSWILEIFNSFAVGDKLYISNFKIRSNISDILNFGEADGVSLLKATNSANTEISWSNTVKYDEQDDGSTVLTSKEGATRNIQVEFTTMIPTPSALYFDIYVYYESATNDCGTRLTYIIGNTNYNLGYLVPGQWTKFTFGTRTSTAINGEWDLLILPADKDNNYNPLPVGDKIYLSSARVSSYTGPATTGNLLYTPEDLMTGVLAPTYHQSRFPSYTYDTTMKHGEDNGSVRFMRSTNDSGNELAVKFANTERTFVGTEKVEFYVYYAGTKEDFQFFYYPASGSATGHITLVPNEWTKVTITLNGATTLNGINMSFMKGWNWNQTDVVYLSSMTIVEETTTA